ncbi:ABC transporter substrate-binding protein [Cohnella herbarum]|uniref:ABC transporter substrate-binding protein n=1 Tax=Cohnella herbarum TaxID=2728023 RepID=A0A7Z2ZKQ1_9BACL|nr:ABC transporter substrate-binding protein [Cohnella herbarum]QJD83014.1 ABC transporter substrate-binding protein [Cohnella herbarum]
MEKKASIVILLIIMLCSLLLAGCAADNRESDKPNKDELILAISSEPESGFDPTTGWGRYGSPLFQSTLLKRDDELKIVNDLADEYEVNKDGTQWTVKLRPNVKFSDGTPLTAEDVIFTFDTAANNGSAIDLTNLQSMEASGDDTVIFTLKEPDSTFITHLVSTGIVPKHAYGENYAEHPIGSGPYKFVQWDKGQQVIVEANPDYYGAKPFFRKLTFLFLSEDAAFAAAKAGKADVAYIPSAYSKQTVPGMRLEDIKTVDNRGIQFPYVPSGGQTDDGNPIGNDVTADIAIRKAVNTAIDRKALVEGILEGYGTPAYSANDELPWWNDQTVLKDADIDEAKKILNDAGWKDADGDGIVEKGALKAEFSMIYPSSDVLRQSLALAAADMVLPAGIRIKVEGKSWDDIGKRMHADAVLFGWGSHDPLEMYNLYSSSYRGMEYYNAGYYSNPVVDDWMSKALRATNEEEAMGYWKKSQWDGKTGLSGLGDAPWAWLVNIDHLYLVKDKLNIGKQRIQPHGHGWPIADNIEQWKWDE